MGNATRRIVVWSAKRDASKHESSAKRFQFRTVPRSWKQNVPSDPLRAHFSYRSRSVVSPYDEMATLWSGVLLFGRVNPKTRKAKFTMSPVAIKSSPCLRSVTLLSNFSESAARLAQRSDVSFSKRHSSASVIVVVVQCSRKSIFGECNYLSRDQILKKKLAKNPETGFRSLNPNTRVLTRKVDF